jgi:biotin carboxylase
VARGPAARDRARLLVLGAGAAQLGLLRAAREHGLFVVAVDRDPLAPGFAYADRRAVVSTEDEQGVERLARAEDVAGLISPGADWPVAVAARVAERLGLPHPIDPATATLATVKTRQRERLAAAGVPQPGVRVVTGPDDDVALPCVVKAPDRQGQRGLALVRERDELAPAIAAAIEASRSGSALVEELADGPEVTVNAFSVEGELTPLTVTDRLTADPPAFGVALAHAWPNEHDTAAAVDAARAAAAALGIRNGPTYTQLRLGAAGPQVIEVAARLGGGHDAELCAAALGVELNVLALDAALGRRPRVPGAQGVVGGACVLFLVAPPGRLVETLGEEDARAVEGVRDVLLYRRPGHVFGPLRRGADRAGAILAVGDSRDDALERARRAADRIRFVVDADAA